MKKYRAIYADPPWKFNNKNTGGSMSSGSANHYPVMDVEDIKRLSVPDICEPNCVLFQWWVGSMPEEAIEVYKYWGFTLKTMTGFVWAKKTKHGKPGFGMGYWTRAGSECCLIATKGKIRPDSRSVRSFTETYEDFSDVQIINAEQIQEHSKKPNVFRDKIDELVQHGNRVELFAREKFENWDAWGNEVESDFELCDINHQKDLFR